MRDDNDNVQIAGSDGPASGSDPLTTTRRTALRLTGGGVALALFASRLDGQAVAQEATPVAMVSRVGAYAVMRSRKLKPDTSIDELTATITEGLLPLIQQIPGFIDYYVVQNFGTLERAGVSIFTSKEGTNESTRVAGEFLTGQGLADLYEDVNPVITEGEIVVAAG